MTPCPAQGTHAMAATTAQHYGSMGGDESEEDGNGPAPGNGGSTGLTVRSENVPAGCTVTQHWWAGFGVGRAWAGS